MVGWQSLVVEVVVDVVESDVVVVELASQEFMVDTLFSTIPRFLTVIVVMVGRQSLVVDVLVVVVVVDVDEDVVVVVGGAGVVLKGGAEATADTARGRSNK